MTVCFSQPCHFHSSQLQQGKFVSDADLLRRKHAHAAAMRQMHDKLKSI